MNDIIETSDNVHRRARTQVPLAVARRWDQLGARLGAIVNARSLAEAFQLEFRFVWPRGADVAINCPSELFSEAYLDEFEILDAELEERTPIPYYEIKALRELDARRMLSLAGAASFVEVTECYDVFRLPTETGAAARARFIRCFEALGWNANVRQLIAACSQLEIVSSLPAVHVRAGDIVSGEWRHLMAHEKYTPTPYVGHVIERLSDGGRKQVLVMSDNDRYLRSLKKRFATVAIAAELVPGYASLPEVQRALADILVLSRCEIIIGPPSSAFSRLGANLGCGQVTRADYMLPKGDEFDVLRRGIAKHRLEAATDPGLTNLLTRDICWCLDVFSDTLPPREQFALAKEAVEIEPEFGGALARLARVAILAGDVRTGLDAASRALSIAESVDRHPDPLLEALATEVGVKCLAAGQGRMSPLAFVDAKQMRWSWRFTRIADDRRRRMKLAVAEVNGIFLRCAELTPFQMNPETILGNLRRLISTLERLSDEDGIALARTARALGRPHPDDLDMCARRPSGLEQHRALGTLDPVTRDLERMAVLLDAAVSRSTAPAALELQ